MVYFFLEDTAGRFFIMEIIGGVTAVPFGLLACRIDGREVQITELGENGFAFRTAEPIAMRKMKITG